MSLTAGSRLGPYEIQSALGSGGMGEVYKASDSRLDRTVAIKVLPEHVAEDRDLRQRFEREAKTLAALSHPHICSVFDVGSQAAPTGSGPAVHYMVMEYLEGETLAARLAKGALPLDQALQVAIQIADALDKAHRQGIVHRDLKPGNIMLTRSGAARQGPPQAKLLDFGLAKLRPAGQPGAVALSQAPTVSSPFGAAQGEPLTGVGSLLGTFQYMAPEQLEGQEADTRTDIFAFGATAYEMITGRRAFEGRSQASVMAAILEREPSPMSTLQPVTPPVLEHIVNRCLAKVPEDRWQAAGDVMRELKWVESGRVAAVLSPDVATGKTRERMVWASVVALLVILLGLAAASWRQPVEPAREVRLEISTPPSTDLLALAISPDGSRVAFVGSTGGRSQVWLRSLDSASAAPLEGTVGASYPFWSPDGASLGFFAEGALKRIDIESGLVQTLAQVQEARGGCWNGDGTILIGRAAGPIERVPASGGEPVAVTSLGGAASHRTPSFLPDGRRFLYFVVGGPDYRSVYVGDLGGTEATRVLTNVDAGAVLTPSGHLLYTRQDTLFAHRFDPVGLTFTGEPVAISQNVAQRGNIAALSVSSTGYIVHRAGSATGRRQFVWVDRAGNEIERVGESGDIRDPALSHDGGFVAFTREEDGVNNIWVLDVARKVSRQFTFSGGSFPVWSPETNRLAFSKNPLGRGGVNDLFLRPISGGSTESALLATPQIKSAQDWSPDGRYVLYRTAQPQTGMDLLVVPVDRREPVPIAESNANEREGQFSPDGRWLAFVSDESGRYDVYVQRFPGPGARQSISIDGGGQPRWRFDGRELFYVSLDGQLMAVPIAFGANGETVRAETPTPLFQTNLGRAVELNLRQQYVVSPDGQRFLVNALAEDATPPIAVILNWRGGAPRSPVSER